MKSGEMVQSISGLKNTGQKTSAKSWLVVALLFFAGGLNYLDRTMITTMRESIMTAMPMTNAGFGLLTSVFLWVYGICSPFGGFLADKFKRSTVITLSLFIWSATTFITAYATTFEQLLATRVLMGISEACYIPAAVALIVDYHKGSTRSLATGIHLAGIVAGQSVGFVGGWLAEKYTWSLSFGIFGMGGVLYSVLLAFILRDPPGQVTQTVKQPVNFWLAMSDLFKRRAFNLLIIFWSLLGIVGWMTMGWLPTYYQERYQLSQTLSGVYATVYLYPASIIGAIAGGYFADRWTRKNPKGIIWVPAIGLLIAAPCILFASYTSAVYVTVVLFFAYAFTRMFSDTNIMPILCGVADERYRATGFGILNFFACVIGGISIYAGGVVRDASIDLGHLFRAAAVMLLLCIVVLYFISQYQQKNKS